MQVAEHCDPAPIKAGGQVRKRRIKICGLQRDVAPPAVSPRQHSQHQQDQNPPQNAALFRGTQEYGLLICCQPARPSRLGGALGRSRLFIIPAGQIESYPVSTRQAALHSQYRFRQPPQPAAAQPWYHRYEVRYLGSCTTAALRLLYHSPRGVTREKMHKVREKSPEITQRPPCISQENHFLQYFSQSFSNSPKSFYVKRKIFVCLRKRGKPLLEKNSTYAKIMRSTNA